MITIGVIERDAVIVSCAISAGVHVALAPEHLAEGRAAGVGFLASAVLLAVAAAAVTRRTSMAALAGACAVLTGLLASYALAITSGIPLIHPEPESPDGLALLTKAVEAVGALAAAHLLRGDRPAVAAFHPRSKGTT